MSASFNLFANFGGFGGYQILTERILTAWSRYYADHKLNIADTVNVFPVQTAFSNNPSTEHLINKSRELENGLYPVSVGIVTPHDVFKFAGKKRALYPTHEGSILVPHLVNQFNELDQLWVSSKYSYNVFKESGVNPEIMKYLPCFIDLEEFKPLQDSKIKERAMLEKEPSPEDPFTFLVIGKFENRKASFQIVEAFLKYFEERDDVKNVRLLCKWSTSVKTRTLDHIKQDLQGVLAAHPNAAARVQLVDDMEVDVIELYNKSECLLMPSRSEGYGLPLFEASGCGIPSVVTPYASFKDYILDEDENVLEDAFVVLPDRGTIPAHDDFFGITPHVFGEWGEVLTEDIICGIDRIWSMSPQERFEMGSLARDAMTEFNYSRAAASTIGWIKEMEGSYGS